MGIADGISLLVLLLIAMPLKYFAGLPIVVTIVGSLHGAIFVTYVIAIAIVQLRIRWHIIYSLIAGVVAFIPFGNFIFDKYIKQAGEKYYAAKINA
ncbi:membrane protein [Kurthia sp. 3B1D]|uniref:Membrane protein n=2 Tax=Caryophanaceae TaxID=186818 RepID=A0A433RQH7_9BACL|nr:membrane protein [Kurthia sp. 3B1D]